MKLGSFVRREKEALAAKLSRYLGGELTHAEMQEHINGVFDKWDALNSIGDSSYTEGEKEFWCAVWATQHLASEDHWLDGTAQKELSLLLGVLKGDLDLPGRYEGRRP